MSARPLTHVEDPAHAPRAALCLVVFTELWERFSYWGLAGLLVLSLTAPPAVGGWGIDGARAINLYGAYSGLAFVLPVFGAWMTDQFLGERRAILWGGVGIVLGHVLLAAPALLPSLLPQASSIAWLVFLSGLIVIVTGTGLLKPAVSSIVARLYPQGGVPRDEAFAYLFVGIYAGAFLGALVPGYVAENWGWHYGFGIAGAGMAIGLAAYLCLQARWLRDIGRTPARREAAQQAALAPADWQRIGILLVQGLFVVTYTVGFYQIFGLLNLYARDEVDRHVGTFEVPTTWMQSISLIGFFVSVPLVAAFWRRLARRDRHPSASYKLAMGLALLAAGYSMLTAMEAGTGVKIGFGWLAAAYLLFGLGDALVWANQLSLTTKLAPRRYLTLFAGAWYVWIGIGTALSGYVGGLGMAYGYVGSFAILAGGLALAAVLLTLITFWMRSQLLSAEGRG